MRTRKLSKFYKKGRFSKKRGGMAIQGQQGCVTIPSLVIDAKKTRNVNYITKLFFEDKYFNDEKENNDFILKEIDPRQSFTAVQYDMNPINVKAISQAELAKCPSLTGKDLTTLKFLNYKYVGRSIDSIVQSSTTFDVNSSKDIVSALANLMVKIHAMNMAGFYHRDAHEGNIMYDERTKHAYLIDFGFAGKQADKPLLDMQLMLNSINITLTCILAFSKLPESYVSTLKAYKDDITTVVQKITNGMPVADAMNLSVKMATDLASNFTRLEAGGKRLTRKLHRNMH
jgi:tRNA A-37 threonylcarbamoyl transferase component Bud32